MLYLVWVVEPPQILQQTYAQTFLLTHVELSIHRPMVVTARLIRQHVTLVKVLLYEHNQIGQIPFAERTFLRDGVSVAFVPLLAEFKEILDRVLFDRSLST